MLTERKWAILGITVLAANVILYLFVGDDLAIIRYCAVFGMCWLMFRNP